MFHSLHFHYSTFFGIKQSLDKCAAMSHSNGIKLQRASSSHKIITIQLEQRGLKKLRMELELPHKVTSLDAAQRFMCFSAHTSATEETHMFASTTLPCCFGIWQRFRTIEDEVQCCWWYSREAGNRNLCAAERQNITFAGAGKVPAWEHMSGITGRRTSLTEINNT